MPSPSESVITKIDTDNVEAALVQPFAFATTEIVPPEEAATVEIVLVVDAPVQPFGSVQV